LHVYHAFGLNIHSEIELPGLPSQGEAHLPAQIKIRLGQLPEHLSGATSTRRYFEASAGQLLVHIQGVGRILVENGEYITYEPQNGAEPSNTRLALINLGISALFHQRGALTLHASAIATPSGAVLFCGKRRAGKSTLAAGLRQHGWNLVCDDKAAMQPENEQVIVTPSFPELRLWQDAIDHLGVRAKIMEKIPEMEKFNISLESGFHASPLPLRAIYLLESGELPTIQFSPITGMNKFQALKQHTYANQFLKGMELLPAHFRLTSFIAQKIPVTKITRPSQINQLTELIDKVDAALRSL